MPQGTTEADAMTELQKPHSGATRTVAVIAVGVLIVVAIAGIVLASRQTGSGDPEVAAVAPVAPVASVALPGSTPSAASAPTPRVENVLIFSAGSDRLPADASEKIARLVESVRSEASSVRVTARFAAGADRARDQELAKRRTAAVHRELLAGGIPGPRLQVELIEVPAGSLPESAVDRLEMSRR